MGYDISLIDANGDSVEVEQFSEGGTQPIGGSTTADISITYNYYKLLHDTIDKDEGIRWLYGKNYAQCVERLELAIGALTLASSDPERANYWTATHENVRIVLALLLSWAEENPAAIFIGD